MNLLALGAELPLEMTPDGQPALNCPVHGTETPVDALLDLGLELLPCGCPRADVAAIWAEQSPMLKEWLGGGLSTDRRESGSTSKPGGIATLRASGVLQDDPSLPLGEGPSRADVLDSSAFRKHGGPSPDLGELSELPEIGGGQSCDYPGGDETERPQDFTKIGGRLSVEDAGLTSMGHVSDAALGKNYESTTSSQHSKSIIESGVGQRSDSKQNLASVKSFATTAIGTNPSQSEDKSDTESRGEANRLSMRSLPGEASNATTDTRLLASPVAPPNADGRAIQSNAPPGGSDGAFTPTGRNEGEQEQNSDSLPVRQAPSVFEWKMMLYELGKRSADELIAQKLADMESLSAQPIEAWVSTVQNWRHHADYWQTNDPAGLSQTEIEEELESVGRALIKKYGGAVAVNGDGARPARALSIIIETDESADVINAEYLSRPEVIERLGYSQSIALIIGAKHHGKSTVTRSLALSVPRGLPVWGRRTNGGPIIYAASDDEVAATRSQLLEMGWRKSKDPLYFIHIKPDSDATPDDILEDIGNEAIRHKAVMIILDMLFDFVGIKNELSYAETRTNIGRVQRLADITKCFTVGTHHTPKYLTDAHEAANAALGSQGVSARFSPIILVRKYAENLFTIESTPTRDPRGQALKPARIKKNDNGWISIGEEFKEWMKWEIYAQRVLDLFEGSKGLSVSDVVQRLNIDRVRAQNTLKQLESNGDLTREKLGHRYLYYRANRLFRMLSQS